VAIAAERARYNRTAHSSHLEEVIMPRGIPPLALFVSVGLLLTIRPAAAAWQPNGVRVCGNARAQDAPSIVTDGAGGAYILWRDLRSYEATKEDHYLQHITAGGDLAPGWPADGVPLCTAPGPQFFGESLIADGQGGAIATWWDRRNGTDDDIYAQRMTAQGTPAPGWPVDGVRLTAILAAERFATLAPDDAGGAFIVWEDGRDGTWDIYGMHVQADGTRAPGWPENGLPVCTLEGNEGLPRPMPDGAGGVWIVWSSGLEVRALRLNAAGERVAGWAENGNLVCGLPHIKGGQVPVPDGAGGMFVVWVDFRTRPPGPPDEFMDEYADLYAQRVQADGTLAPGWPVDGLALCTAPRSQQGHRVAPDGAGGFLVAWGDYRDVFTEGEDVYALRVRGDGTLAPGWTAGGVRASDEPGYQFEVQVAADGQGGAYLVYNDLEGSYKLAAQHLTGVGVPAPGWPSNGRRLVDITGGQLSQVIVADGAGGAIVAWSDSRGAQSDPDIYAQRIGPDGPTPVLVSLVSAEAEPGLVRLTWFAGQGGSLNAAIERRAEMGEWERLASIAADGSGKLTYEDRAVTPGTRYAYRLSYSEGAEITYTAETWVTVPAPRFALRGLTPNPSAGDPVVAFSLASDEPATLELFDIHGRLVLSRGVGATGVGAQSVRLDGRGRLAAGIYTVRLRQGASMATARAVIVR
jgi:hypothetical protein